MRMNIEQIFEIRRDNLQREASAYKSVAEFARKYGFDATYIRQIVNNHRELGEKSARSIELALGKPFCYLDMPHNTNDIIYIISALKGLPPEALKQIRLTCRVLAEEYGTKLPE